jgi:hypothetical protein
VSTANAVARETEWLSITNDSLPALLTTGGGPFEVLQAYRPRSPRTRASQLYVLRRGLRETRFANVRRMPTYVFELQIIWPLGVSGSTGSAEVEQQNLDDAVDLVLQRVGGLTFDKTHGGRFRSVAEDPRWVEVTFTDPKETIAAKADFECSIQYSADDPEFTG